MMADMIEPKTPSNTETPHVITQMVIANGAQTKIPAMKYFFIEPAIIGLSGGSLVTESSPKSRQRSISPGK